MTRSASVSRLKSEFDDFLFAPIGEERNGMLLSVLSALARLDVDPWQEAADLARLPRDSATQRLATLMTKLPGEPSTHLDLGSISVRLIALLPSRSSSNIASPETMLGVNAMTKSGAFIYFLFFLMAVMVGAQFMAASRQPPTQVGNAHAAPSRAVSTQMPLPTLGQ